MMQGRYHGDETVELAAAEREPIEILKFVQYNSISIDMKLCFHQKIVHDGY